MGLGGSGPRTFSWGTGWEIVVEDLYTYAAQRGNFRFVIEIPSGGSTEAAVEANFPRMKLKGWLLIKWRREDHMGRWRDRLGP